MTPVNRDPSGSYIHPSLEKKLQEALQEPDLIKRSAKLEEVKQLVSAQQEEIDLAAQFFKNVDRLKSTLLKLEPLLRLGPGSDQYLWFGEALATYQQFDEFYNEFKGQVTNLIVPLLDEIIQGMAEDLYEFGTLGSPDFDDYHEQSRHLTEVFGPNGNIHLKEFQERKLGRRPIGDSPTLRGKKRPDEDTFRTHLKNVLFLSSIREANGTRKTQKEISELTDKSQSKISLDLFMAKQVLLESWLEERLKAVPNLEITVGATGVSKSNEQTLDIDDTYDRWPRDGFGYMVLENTFTRKAVIIMLHVFEHSAGALDGMGESVDQLEGANSTLDKRARNPRRSSRSRKRVIQSYVSQLQTSSTSELAKRYPYHFSSLPIGHFISTGRYYETAFILDEKLPQYFEMPGIGGDKKEDSIADLFS